MSKIILLTIIVTLLGFDASAKVINYDERDKEARPEEVIKKLAPSDRPIVVVNYKYSSEASKLSIVQIHVQQYVERTRREIVTYKIEYKEDQTVDEDYINNLIEQYAKARGYNFVIRSNKYEEGNPDKITLIELRYFLIM